jgi:DNA-directed RNA polymerase subunit RPC12/RpoP
MTINLDRKRIYIHCPRCNFWARPFLRQIRHRETIVCAGCKANIRLDDHLGSFRKTQRQVNRALEDLKAQLGNMTINIQR